MKQTYTGGCHCGAVRYEADVDLSHGTMRCNCSICSKTRAWLIAVNGKDFRLQTGTEALSEYQFGAHRIHHLFCNHCGIKSFARGKGREGEELYAVAVNCLNGVSDADLATLPVTYVDGRSDNFKSPPAETRHL
jgi:hypothetical protein